jgi:formylglycine-generating enzyme required for sulfatase activity
MGLALTQATNWLSKRAADIQEVDRSFIVLSREADRRRQRRVRALVGAPTLSVILVLVGWLNQSYLQERINWYWTLQPYMLAQVRPYVLTAEDERALKPGADFRECAKDCPEMIVVPAGEFTMGSAEKEKDRNGDENPRHKSTIAKPFAVSKFDVTFADWDTCVSAGGCPEVSDASFGRGTKPVINVTWADAQRYVMWFSKMTGRDYRLLSETEWEYVARAGAATVYHWGDEIGTDKANCDGCGSVWNNLGTSPVGYYKDNANAFGLYDISGNVWQWVQDCYHGDYNGAPTDGSAWTSGDCSRHVVRGGSWANIAKDLRVARRHYLAADYRDAFTGFRIARTLTF